MSKIGRIEAEWIGYRAHVIPVEAGPVQVEECRRAFYGGAQMLMIAIVTQLSPDAEPTDADVQVMTEIHEELKAFFASYKTKGRG